MFSTADKISTMRRATAQAILRATPALIEVLRSRQGPKGDALEIARVAGVMAGKRTPEFIPFCHPIPIDQIDIAYEWSDTSVTIRATVTAIWKTGVEMEALIAAQIAAATLYDMLKPIDTAMSIEDVRVLEKSGGKSTYHDRPLRHLRAAVLVTSDRSTAGTRPDASGPRLQALLAAAGVSDCQYLLLPDEATQITEALLRFVRDGVDLVITSGGTGLGPRDVTARTTRALLDRELPGIVEAARHYGQQRNPYAMLSGGVAGIKDRTLIVNLPGSLRAAEEYWQALFPALFHAIPMIRGKGHD